MNEIDSSFVVKSYQTLTDGYLIEYIREDTIYMFDLSIDLRIRRKEVRKVIQTPSTS